jgi:hypothetical protein
VHMHRATLAGLLVHALTGMEGDARVARGHVALVGLALLPVVVVEAAATGMAPVLTRGTAEALARLPAGSLYRQLLDQLPSLPPAGARLGLHALPTGEQNARTGV